MTRTIFLLFACIGVALIIASCPESPQVPDTPPDLITREGWSLRQLKDAIAAEVYEIVMVGDRQLPNYADCYDENGGEQPSEKCALSLLFLPSPDYHQGSDDNFTQHAQAVLQEVFDSPNSLNQRGVFHNRTDTLEPFKFYVTDYRYPANTPDSNTSRQTDIPAEKIDCSLGLPLAWVPETPNLGDINEPSFDCNIALSTAGAGINVGFVMHQENEPDRSQGNLFSSEYNSYTAILHELSHAAFVIADEAPNADDSGRFFPTDFQNIFRKNQYELCQDICLNTYQSQCVAIESLDDYPSGFFRCAPESDDTNLMYFFPPPAPGDNANWNSYVHQFAAAKRLGYVYEKCEKAQC